MKIERFYDDNLAHASYAILSENEVALVDPARNPQQYYDFAEKHNAKIVAVFETHPHADFVSSHLEVHQETGATIYVSELLGADYPHKTFDEGDEVSLGKLKLKALNTPGHSPDSISIVAYNENGEEEAVFTGDTLFIGDVGRPDLRENVGNMKAKREALAKDMYHTMQNKYNHLKDETVVYPAHGAGSLCGKNLSSDASSTLGKERKENWAFKKLSEGEFVSTILQDQPFIPKYFGFDVDTNKKGPAPFKNGVQGVKKLNSVDEISADAIVVDVRNEADFKKGHLPNSVNIMLTEKSKFETWLGAIVSPEEKFYLIAADEEQLNNAIERTAKIGYEQLIKGAVAVSAANLEKQIKPLNVEEFSNTLDFYSIVDIRNEGEVKNGKFFKNAITIPLHELRERAHEIPTDKPVVVHCAAGYRSAAGSSILESELKDVEVYDLGEAINKFK